VIQLYINISIKKLGLYFSCIFVAPCLFVLTVGLYLIGILFSLGTVLEVFGVISSIFNIFNINQIIQFSIGSWIIPNFLKVPVALVVGFLLVFVGKRIWKALKMYISYIRKV